ncbi:hypothetical protein AX15_005501 [Amanita polypyramis BW_CC]|nr:hypothetical protein AX15_005501 [Amanita polypyramis BW_CC]
MPQLPIEIWLEIFQWATGSLDFCTLSHYAPFQTLSAAGDKRDGGILKIKRNLSLVCRQWKELTAELLYKDIRIVRGVEDLKTALQTLTSDGNTYGCWVQRVTLPFSSTITGPHESSTTATSIHILKLCSKIRILVRPQYLVHNLQFQSEAQIVSFPSLERLEWWHNNDAERSGGINSLTVVLSMAPNLTYLFIGGLAGHARITPRLVSLPQLTILRLRIVDGLLLHQIMHNWTLPSLEHIILDTPGLSAQNLSMIWDSLGPQLRTVEFGKHHRFLLNGPILPCLQGCPRLEEINYFALFTMSARLTESHYTLRRVGLHADVNSSLTEPGSAWSLLEHHFNVLLSHQLPLLQRIVLYGDWRGAVAHPRFEPILRRSYLRGRLIAYPDGTRVTNYS